MYPEIVHTDEEGNKSVDYSLMTVVLAEAVKDLKKENDDLKREHLEMKKKLERLSALEDKMDKLLPREW